jgi:hypothetical protein
MQERLPAWEPDWDDGSLIDEAIEAATKRLEAEKEMAENRAVQLAREKAYHRLAVAIDRTAKPRQVKGQLSLFPTDPTLFDATPRKGDETP